MTTLSLRALAARIALCVASVSVIGSSWAAQPPPVDGSLYQQYAPIDLTGNWVSLVTEDWQWRMITPPKGDLSNLPLNAEGERVTNSWDPARDEAAGMACQAYAAPSIMREPGRLRIAWVEGGNALRVETDAGQQTRLFQFGAATPSNADRTWQGFSLAEWQYAGRFNLDAVGSEIGPAGRRSRNTRPSPARPNGGALKVVTNQLRAGYLRKNGVPFSENAVVTEYFNVYTDVDLAQWLVVTTIVHDPKYLRTDYITSSNFRKEPDGSKWKPRPCVVRD
jgi:hypothetical protein